MDFTQIWVCLGMPKHTHPKWVFQFALHFDDCFHTKKQFPRLLPAIFLMKESRKLISWEQNKNKEDNWNTSVEHFLWTFILTLLSISNNLGPSLAIFSIFIYVWVSMITPITHVSVNVNEMSSRKGCSL